MLRSELESTRRGQQDLGQLTREADASPRGRQEGSFNLGPTSLHLRRVLKVEHEPVNPALILHSTDISTHTTHRPKTCGEKQKSTWPTSVTSP
jgi:hypothetical protein